ncbi:unnamed protein product [Strongylus vulgaris]|uniref:Uncharacterized protein n=1 Tax=Strongylus vulgaris TaxID=40348 RepID=A0A3P7J416_STRVU|nr:unnamed protein product [Strongylus vulgaris]
MPVFADYEDVNNTATIHGRLGSSPNGAADARRPGEDNRHAVCRLKCPTAKSNSLDNARNDYEGDHLLRLRSSSQSTTICLH